MIVCGHQPNFLPYVGFFHKMMNCDQFVLVDNVEFVGKGPFGWIHRNKVRINDKKEHWLTVPVITSGRYHQDINEVEINNDEPWQRKHWRTIKLNYQNTDYFDEYAPGIREIYNRDWDKLVNLNVELLNYLIDCLEIDVPVVLSSDEGISGESTQLIINLCEAFEADTYLSGMHGKDYLDRELVNQSSIEVIFQEFEHPTYDQPYDDFVSHLSVLDMLFNCGPESKDMIRNAGTFTRSWTSK